MLDTMLSYLGTRVLEPSMLLQNLVTVGCALLLLAPPAKTPRARGRLLLGFGGLLLELMLLNALWDLAFQAPGSYYLTHPAVLVSCAAAKRKLRDRAHWITIIDFYAVEIALISLSSVFPLLLQDAAHGGDWEILFRNCTVLLTPLVALFFRRCSLLRFHGLGRVHLGYSALVGASTLAISLLFFFQREQFNVYGYAFSLVVFVCVLIISLVAHYLNYSTCIHQEREKQLMVENFSMQNYREMLRLNQQNLEDMRRLRHDMKNHLACLDGLLKQGDYAEASAYFERFRRSAAPPLTYIDCGNPCLNAILNLEASKARSYGVTLDYRVVAQPRLPVADDALCALLTNLIDNALEAIQRQKVENGAVEVGINQREGQLYICVRNTVARDIEESVLLSLRTTKADRQLHGYGHRIVADIVEQYGGMLHRSVRDGLYTVDIVLDLGE